MDKPSDLSLDLSLGMKDNKNNKVASGAKENGIMLFGVRVTEAPAPEKDNKGSGGDVDGDGGNKSESGGPEFDCSFARDDQFLDLLSPHQPLSLTKPDLSITDSSIMDKLTQLNIGSPFFTEEEKKNDQGCTEMIDNPIESEQERPEQELFWHEYYLDNLIRARMDCTEMTEQDLFWHEYYLDNHIRARIGISDLDILDPLALMWERSQENPTWAESQENPTWKGRIQPNAFWDLDP